MALFTYKSVISFIFITLIISSSHAADSSIQYEKLIPVEFSCGDSTQDSNDQLVCCHLDEKLYCNEKGECWCKIDQYCQQECHPEGNCGTKPSCLAISNKENLLL